MASQKPKQTLRAWVIEMEKKYYINHTQGDIMCDPTVYNEACLRGDTSVTEITKEEAKYFASLYDSETGLYSYHIHSSATGLR